ncbi:MAG: hypothetical protein PHC53_04000 [Patescibacteria group bacterium]|nr:hypothetical protein [Patescibacteria group bacterium]
MLENFFNKINQTVDAKRNETPSSMAPTLKKTVELKPEDLEPVVGPSEKAPTLPKMPGTPLVAEKDIHGPLEAGAETLPHQEAQTLKTDATVVFEKAPTIRLAGATGEKDEQSIPTLKKETAAVELPTIKEIPTIKEAPPTIKEQPSVGEEPTIKEPPTIKTPGPEAMA